MKEEVFSLQYYKIVAAVYIIIAFLSFTLNFIVLATFATNKSLRTPRNILLICMAVIDLLSSLPTSMGAYANFVLFWTLDPLFCHLFAFNATFCGLCSIWNHVALAAERLVTIKWTFLQLVNRKNIAIVVSILALFSLSFSIFPLIGWSSYSPEPGFAGCSVTWHPSTSSDIAYVMALFAFFFFTPIIAMATCYVCLHKELKSMTRKAKSTWGNDSAQSIESVLAKKRNCKLSLVMSLAFLAAWTPYAVVTLYMSFGGNIPFPSLVVLPSMFAKFSAIYNSIIYFFMYRKFRRAVLKMVMRSQNSFRSLHSRLRTSLSRTHTENV
uniref:Opsin n=1 Tax=Exaiptasia diaphana TaxID=2652724 RepID=A0A346FU05_EXADI|nr:opsin [Exaiptasia diaphana]